jgi:hypothetical protein
VRAYFDNGDLPAEGTDCEPDGPAFDMGDVAVEAQSSSRRRSI